MTITLSYHFIFSGKLRTPPNESTHINSNLPLSTRLRVVQNRPITTGFLLCLGANSTHQQSTETFSAWSPPIT